MRKIKVYIATSLDGYIARPDGDLDWLTEFPNPMNENYGYDEMLASVDTVVMGGRTYHELSCMDILWPYKNKMTYVVSHNAIHSNEHIEFITENVIEKISELRDKEGKDIWLAGGGKLIALLLNARLVDELQICYFPIILGAGIPLFPDTQKQSNCELIKNTTYESGVTKVKYMVIK